MSLLFCAFPDCFWRKLAKGRHQRIEERIERLLLLSFFCLSIWVRNSEGRGGRVRAVLDGMRRGTMTISYRLAIVRVLAVQYELILIGD